MQIAVVVQELVPADFAGVMFTAEPVTGERDRIVIDASPGLGEAVVSGLVTPDHTTLDARDRVVEHRAGRAEIAIRPDENGGTRQDAAVGAEGTAEAAAACGARRGRSSHRRALRRASGHRVGVRRGPPVDPAVPAAHGAAARPRDGRIPSAARWARSSRSSCRCARTRSTWRRGPLRGHGRILTRMLAELPGLRLDLGRMLPETDGVVDELVPPEPRPTSTHPHGAGAS